MTLPTVFCKQERGALKKYGGLVETIKRMLRIFLAIFLFFLLGVCIVLFALDIGNPQSRINPETEKVPTQEEKTPRKGKGFYPLPQTLATDNTYLGTIFLAMRNMEALEERQKGNTFQKVKIAGVVSPNMHENVGSVLFEFFGSYRRAFFLSHESNIFRERDIGTNR